RSVKSVLYSGGILPNCIFICLRVEEIGRAGVQPTTNTLTSESTAMRNAPAYATIPPPYERKYMRRLQPFEYTTAFLPNACMRVIDLPTVLYVASLDIAR